MIYKKMSLLFLTTLAFVLHSFCALKTGVGNFEIGSGQAENEKIKVDSFQVLIDSFCVLKNTAEKAELKIKRKKTEVDKIT